MATVKDPSTDHTRWRLEDDNGRQTWHYLTSDQDVKKWPQTTADKYHLGLDTVCKIVLLGGQGMLMHVTGPANLS